MLLLVISGSALPASGERILVFAPHPDDEVVSLGGWLADRIASGATVWAAIVTDGEAFPKAIRANRIARSPILRSPEFLRLGKLRREEGRRSLACLGIPSERRFFLGYPCNALWKIYRSSHPDEPIRSKATNQRFGLAELGLEKGGVHPFSRNAWAADTDALLKKANPDVILLPYQLDSNSDHRAVGMMVGERWRLGGKHGGIMGYLVHHGSRFQYPRPLGYHPMAPLNAPPGFPKPTTVLVSWRGMDVKEKAIRFHKTQVNLKDGFLLGFIRRQKIFWPLNPLDLERFPLHLPETSDSENILEGSEFN